MTLTPAQRQSLSWLLIAAGFALAYPSWIADLAGIVVVVGVLAVQYLRPQARAAETIRP